MNRDDEFLRDAARCLQMLQRTMIERGMSGTFYVVLPNRDDVFSMRALSPSETLFGTQMSHDLPESVLARINGVDIRLEGR